MFAFPALALAVADSSDPFAYDYNNKPKSMKPQPPLPASSYTALDTLEINGDFVTTGSLYAKDLTVPTASITNKVEVAGEVRCREVVAEETHADTINLDKIISAAVRRRGPGRAQP